MITFNRQIQIHFLEKELHAQYQNDNHFRLPVLCFLTLLSCPFPFGLKPWSSSERDSSLRKRLPLLSHRAGSRVSRLLVY